VKTPNEARDGLGLEPIKGGEKPIVIAGATIVLLQDIEALSDKAVNPPEPMVGAPMGQSNGAGRGGAMPSGRGAGGRGDASAGDNRSRPTAKPAGAQNGSAADTRKVALEREARQLLRRSRAAPVEGVLALR
ncbi:MAG TPA: hypothetical protein VGK96_22025, partial [Candidatus Sulfotelmatobacter sp.]